MDYLLTKPTLRQSRLIILGLFFVLLPAIFTCGYIQAIGHFVDIPSLVCSDTVFFTGHVGNKEEVVFATLFLSFIASVTLLRFLKGDGRSFCRRFSIFLCPSAVFLRVRRLIYKLYGPLLAALRRGILNPQIYNLKLIANQ